MKLIMTDIKSPIVIYKGKIRSMIQNRLFLQPQHHFLQEGKDGYGCIYLCAHACICVYRNLKPILVFIGYNIGEI